MPTKKEPPKTLRRRRAIVEFDDGRIEEYNLGAPIHEYNAAKLGVDLLAAHSVFWVIWEAAGRPGTNGGVVTLDSAQPAFETWLGTIVNNEVVVGDSAPPTSQREASRT